MTNIVENNHFDGIASSGAADSMEGVNPPCSNRGVRSYGETDHVSGPTSSEGAQAPEKKEKKGVSPHEIDFSSTSFLDSAFFDWYQAAVEVDPEQVIADLCEHFGASARMAKPQPPYLQCRQIVPMFSGLKEDSEVVPYCSVHYGGINSKSMIRATSDRAIEMSAYVRDHYPEHTISRIDVALDFCEGPEFFSDLAHWFIDYASGQTPMNPRRLKTSFQGDWAFGRDGRTLNVGSRESVVMVRVYEKGIEQQQKGNVDAPSDWVRLEAEIKPGKNGRSILSKASPRDCFGASQMLRDFAAVFADTVEPMRVGTVWSKTDWERSFAHMCYQYGATIEGLLERCSDDRLRFAEVLLDRVRSEKKDRKGVRELKEHRSSTFQRGNFLDKKDNELADDYE